MLSRHRLALVATLLLTLTAWGTTTPHRQYYSSWHKHSQRGFHFRHFYFKPHQHFIGFRHHYVLHFPHRPRFLYFYNPYTKQYWGRSTGKAAYSLLAEKDRRGKLDEIPESAFPSPGEMPQLPESKDGTRMDLPPDDLPEEEAPPQKPLEKAVAGLSGTPDDPAPGDKLDVNCRGMHEYMHNPATPDLYSLFPTP